MPSITPLSSVYSRHLVPHSDSHLGEVVARLEQIALLGVPHAVIRPGAGVRGIGGERPLVPDLGVVVAAELAAGIADQVGDVGVVVMAERFQLVDAGGVVVALVDHRMRGLVAVDELLLGFLLVLLRRLLFLVGLGRSSAPRLRLRRVRHRARAVDGARGQRDRERERARRDQGVKAKWMMRSWMPSKWLACAMPQQ